MSSALAKVVAIKKIDIEANITEVTIESENAQQLFSSAEFVEYRNIISSQSANQDENLKFEYGGSVKAALNRSYKLRALTSTDPSLGTCKNDLDVDACLYRVNRNCHSKMYNNFKVKYFGHENNLQAEAFKWLKLNKKIDTNAEKIIDEVPTSLVTSYSILPSEKNQNHLLPLLISTMSVCIKEGLVQTAQKYWNANVFTHKNCEGGEVIWFTKISKWSYTPNCKDPKSGYQLTPLYKNLSENLIFQLKANDTTGGNSVSPQTKSKDAAVN